MHRNKTGLNPLLELIAGFINACVETWRALTGIVEDRPDPYYVSRYQAWDPKPAPEVAAAAWFPPTPVSLVKAPNLVRRYVQAIGRATVKVNMVKAPRPPRTDELGLPVHILVDRALPTVGIFEQTVAAWRLCKRDWSDDVSWA